MAMNNHNRQNPFMYLLESKNDELSTKATTALKSFIIITTLEIELCVLFTIFCFVSHTFNIFMTLGLILPYISLLFHIIDITKTTNMESAYVNDIIFSDKYKFIDLNNEQLLSKINKYNIYIGRVESTISCSRFFLIFQLVYNACFIMYFIHIIYNIFI